MIQREHTTTFHDKRRCLKNVTKCCVVTRGNILLQAELEPWKDSGEVKELDEQIVEVYNSLAKVREWV
jgi:hypothetical protein